MAEVIERRYGYHVPEPEIGFLAIHFGAAEVRLESRKEYRRKVDVGIVCASGIGISRLMSSKISRAFADRVQLSAYGIADLTPYVLKRNDFLVSSMALKEEADILYVSPLLPPEDMEKIARKVRQYEYVSKRLMTKRLQHSWIRSTGLQSVSKESSGRWGIIRSIMRLHLRKCSLLSARSLRLMPTAAY